MALTSARNTTEIEDCRRLVLPVAAGTKIFDGCLVVIGTDGYAQPATKAENLKAVGRAEEFVDNTNGADGAVTIEVRRGVFLWDNDPTTANQITDAHVLGNCYIVDDSTVTSLATGSSVAGKVVGIYDEGIAVETL